MTLQSSQIENSIPGTEGPFFYSSLAGDDDLAELIEMFVEEMPQRIENLLAQYEAQNWEELRRAAHQMKGAGGSYGFDSLTAPALKLETALKENKPQEQIQSLLDELLVVCRGVRTGSPK